MKELFHRFAKYAADITGSPLTFIVAVGIVVVWAVTGPLFHFSDTWQLTINTLCSIVPSLMVFLIQNTQNRDSRALQLKLDEVLVKLDGRRSPFIDMEELPEHEIDRLAAVMKTTSRRDPE